MKLDVRSLKPGPPEDTPPPRHFNSLLMPDFAIPPDSPLVDGRDPASDVFAWDHALIIGGMHVLAFVGLWFWSWPALAAFLVMHTLCLGVGVIVGFHRLFSHKVFRCSPIVLYAFATLGTLAFQGGPLLWAATHRVHHRHPDEHGDAHSSERGFWWSHIGWTLYRRPNGFRFREAKRIVSDLSGHRFLVFLDRHAIGVNIAAFAVFAALVPRWDVLLWAFPVRIVVDWHLIWLINSYAHFAPLRGRKDPPGTIRDSALLSAFLFGEGWHAKHHASPGLANLATEPGQIDLGFVIMRGLDRIGLIRLRNREGVGLSTQPTNTETE